MPKIANWVTLTCTCGQTFQRRASELAYGKKPFCGRECASRYNTSEWRKYKTRYEETNETT